MVVVLLSMEGQKALGFHPKKYRNLCYKGLTDLEQHEGEELMTEFSGLGEPVLGVSVAQW